MANIVCKNCFLKTDQLSKPYNKLPGGHKWSKTSCEDNLGN